MGNGHFVEDAVESNHPGERVAHPVPEPEGNLEDGSSEVTFSKCVVPSKSILDSRLVGFPQQFVPPSANISFEMPYSC